MAKEVHKMTFAGLFVIFMQLNFILGSSGFRETSGFLLFNISTYILAIFCLIMEIILNKRRDRISNIMLLIVVAILALIGYRTSGAMTFLKLILFGICLYRSDYYEVVKAYLIGNCLSLFLIITCSYIGIIGYWSSELVGKNYSLGFMNANECASVFFSTLVCLVILIGENHKYVTNLIILITILVILFLIRSRSATLSLVLLFILYNISVKVKASRGSRALSFLIFPLFTILSLYIAINFTGSGLFQTINLILSGRFETWHAYYNTFRINALGNYFVTGDFLALDNAYLYLLFRYGLIVYIIYFLIFMRSTKDFINREQWMILSCFIVFEVYGLMEFSPITINKNIALAIWLCQRGTEVNDTNL